MTSSSFYVKEMIKLDSLKSKNLLTLNNSSKESVKNLTIENKTLNSFSKNRRKPIRAYDKGAGAIVSSGSDNKFNSNKNYKQQGFTQPRHFKFKRKYNKLPKASNNHFRFLLKYLFLKIIKNKTVYFQNKLDFLFDEQKELFRFFILYITFFDKRKLYKAISLARLFVKPQSRRRIKSASSEATHDIMVQKKYTRYAYNWRINSHFKRRFAKSRVAKKTRKFLDRKLKRHLRIVFKKNKYKNLFWLKSSAQSRKTLLILWRKYYYAPAWRPFVYLHKKNKLFFNFGDKYVFGRFPLHKYKYPLLFFFPRYADYRRLYKNQLKEQHIFRWVYRLKFSQLIKRFRKSINGTKRIFELMFLKYFEFRLDTIVYRLNFAFSLKHARQLVNRGLFMLNNKTIHNYAYHMTIGDVIMPIKRVRLQGKRLKYLNSKAKGYFLMNMRLFYRPIQADQYMDYLFINERIPAGMIINNIDTSTLRFNRSFSIQYLTLSLLKYN